MLVLFKKNRDVLPLTREGLLYRINGLSKSLKPIILIINFILSLRMSENNNLKLLNKKNSQCNFTISVFFIFIILIIISISENFTILQDSSATQQPNSTNINNGIKSNDFLLYENSTYGIKISYPENWFLETSSSQETYP